MNVGAAFRNLYQVECWRDGKKVWEEERHNLVVNQGLDDVLNKYFKGSSYTAAHYVGLKGVGSIAATHTLASHTGWTELTIYSGSRPRLTLGNVSAQAINNSANKAQFNINGSGTVAGVIVTTVASGTGGVLYGAVDFSQNRAVVSGDILIVTCTFTQRSV